MFTHHISNQLDYLAKKTGISTNDVSINTFAMIFLLPPLLFLVMLGVVPIGYALYLSVWDLGTFQLSYTDFVFLGNYVDLATSQAFWLAAGRGTVYVLGSLVFQIPLAVALALVFNEKFFGRQTIQTLVIFPIVIPTIVVVIMWQWLLSPVYGVVNFILLEVGIITEYRNWFQNRALAWPAIIIAGGWKFTAFAFLIIFARLQSIDDRMYEQAKVSGATRYQMFRDITLPNLRSAILLVVLLRGVWTFNQFDIIWMFTQGGPGQFTTTLPILVFREAFWLNNLGMAAALSMSLFVLLSVAAVLYFWYFEPSKEVET